MLHNIIFIKYLIQTLPIIKYLNSPLSIWLLTYVLHLNLKTLMPIDMNILQIDLLSLKDKESLEKWLDPNEHIMTDLLPRTTNERYKSSSLYWVEVFE